MKYRMMHKTAVYNSDINSFSIRLSGIRRNALIDAQAKGTPLSNDHPSIKDSKNPQPHAVVDLHGGGEGI